jgi:hypothetical protein
MTDFAKELEGKAYQLCNGMIELEEFKSWFAMAKAALAPDAPAAFTLTPHQAYGHVSAGKNREFSDYYQRPYEPMDADMEAHHRKLMGGGDP